MIGFFDLPRVKEPTTPMLSMRKQCRAEGGCPECNVARRMPVKAARASLTVMCSLLSRQRHLNPWVNSCGTHNFPSSS